MHLRQGLLAAVSAALGLALAASGADAAKLHYISRQIGTFPGADYLTAPPTGRGRLFVVFQKGVVRIVDHGKPRATPFLDQRDITLSSDQRGLLGLVFAPDYATS